MKISDLATPCPLFAGIEEKERAALFTCLSATQRAYRKGEFIFRAGSKPVAVGIVLSGGALVLQEDFWGHRMIVAHIQPGGLFAEAFSCVENRALPVSITASEHAEILLINFRKIFSVCSNNCVFHARLILNMVGILAEKNILLTQKMEHLSKRTTREKLLSFLSAQALLARQSVVDLPFNRQELADYLCVDRSALSRELGMMQAEGLLTCERNRFELQGGKLEK